MRIRLSRLFVIALAFVAFGSTYAAAEVEAPARIDISEAQPMDQVGPNTAERPEGPLQPIVGEGTREVGPTEGTRALSPAGCIGKSNNPHQSGWEVKGVTQIDCNWAVNSLRTTAQVWRHRWWGYEKIGIKGDNTNPWDDQVKASGFGDTACETNWYRTSGEHWSLEGTTTYYLSTLKNAEVNC